MTIVRLHGIAMYLENKIKELGFNVNYKVQNVYADFGLGTTHETIVATDINGNNSFQIFSPVELEKIANDEFRPVDANNIVEKHAMLFEKWGTPKLN